MQIERIMVDPFDGNVTKTLINKWPSSLAKTMI